MRTTKMYRYIGVNGTVITPILLDCPHKIEFYLVTADKGKMLIDPLGNTAHSVEIPEEELSKWSEVLKDESDN